MTKSVFVSHVFEDRSYVDKLRLWAKEGRLGNVAITGETRDVRQLGDEAIKKELNPKLKGAGAIVVLIGNDTHNRAWIEHEIQHAKSHHKHIIPVRIPNTTGAAPPSLQGQPLTTFEPTTLAKVL